MKGAVEDFNNIHIFEQLHWLHSIEEQNKNKNNKTGSI